MYKILVVTSPIYFEMYTKKFKKSSFFDFKIMDKYEAEENFNELFEYHAIIFQIDYPFFPETLERIEKARQLFQGVFIVSDYYEYFNHKTFASSIKADLYYPLVNGMNQLLAQLKSLVVGRFMLENGKIAYKDIVLDLGERNCFRSHRKILLRNREFELLKFFLENPSVIFTKLQLLEAVWDMNSDVNTNTVQSHICFLRRKIDVGFDEKRLHTVNCVGYKFE